MEFHERFSKYSNIELLKIIRTKEEYQLTAIQTAEKILSERTISNEDRQEVENYFTQKNKEQEKKEKKISELKNHILDITTSFIQPSEKTDLNKWFKVLLFALVLQYLWNFYRLIKNIFESFKYSTDFLNFYFLFYIAQIVYVSLIFYFVYKKNKIGWIIMFCDAFICLFGSIPNLFMYTKYIDVIGAGTNPSKPFFEVFLRGAILAFLWRKEVCEYFSVTEKVKQKTFKIILAISLIILVCMMVSILLIK